MNERFSVTMVIENGESHYKIYDYETDQTVHCDIGELAETMSELMCV